MAWFLRHEHTNRHASAVANMQKASLAPDLVLNSATFGRIRCLHFKGALLAYNLLFSSEEGI